MTDSGKVSMLRVSELAGVSTATVSRALKKPEMVSLDTRERILIAVNKLGYRPNMLARSFYSGKTETILVIVTGLTNPFFTEIVKGIEEVAQQLGYSVLLGDTEDDLNRELVYAEMVLNNRADGLIQLGHAFPFAEKDAELARKVPIVSVCDAIDGEYKFPYVTIDNIAASRDVASHLLSLGHTKIGAISGQQNSKFTSERLGGLKRVLQENGIEFNDEWYITGSYSKQSGQESAEKLLQLEDLPTAIFCFSDEIAIGAIKAIKNKGLKVPEDISIVGFDNIDICEFIDPPITTIEQPATEMGRKAMHVLYKMMTENKVDHIAEYKPYKLVIRGSTGPAPPLK